MKKRRHYNSFFPVNKSPIINKIGFLTLISALLACVASVFGNANEKDFFPSTYKYNRVKVSI